MRSYSPERHEWEMEIQTRYALDIYKHIWRGCKIEEVDKEAMENDFAKRRDFSGLDKIIKVNGNEIHLAQRFRKPRKDGGAVDFSFRYKTLGLDGNPREAEYFLLLEAYREGYWYPNKYAFGVTKGENIECGGFTEFYVFNLSPLLEAIDNGWLTEIGIYPNRGKDGIPDGSSGIYFRIENLKEFIFWEMPKGQITLDKFF